MKRIASLTITIVGIGFFKQPVCVRAQRGRGEIRAQIITPQRAGMPERAQPLELATLVVSLLPK